MENKPLAQENHNNFSLPSVKELFSDSYKAFTKSLLTLIILSFINLLAVALVLLFAGLSLIPLGVFKQISKLISNPQDLSVLKDILLSGGVIFSISSILMFIFGYVFQVSTVLAVADYETRPAVGSIIKRSFKYILPLILINFLMFFLIFGGLFVFIIPGLILGLFFMFGLYEVVLSNERPVQALRKSVSLVSQHFGEIIVRQFIYLVGYVFFVVFIPNLIRKIDPQTGVIISFYVSLVSIFIGWFGLAFSVTLYKQVKKANDVSKKTGLIWIVLFAIAGWLIGGFIIFYAYKGITSKYGSTILNSLSKKNNQESNKVDDSDRIISYAPSECGLLIPVPKTEDTYEGVNRKWLFEEIELNPKGFYALDKDSLPTNKLLGSFLGFKDNASRLGGAQFKVSYPGVNILCVDNAKNLTEDEYVGLALLNKEYKITKQGDKKSRWGELLLTPIYIEGKDQTGMNFKDSAYIGVSKDGKKLLQVVYWGVVKEDPNQSTINEDIDIIIRNLKYRGKQ